MVREGSKYDLRGAQFAGGLAETVQGDQIGGTIHNDLPEPSDPSTPDSTRPTIETKAIDLGNGVNLELVLVPGGKFLMGSPEREEDDNDSPQHKVTISEFWMGKYPVTQAQYKAVTGKSPSRFKGDNLPVEQVDWCDAVEFCKRLSKKTGKSYRLLSEAEWEYACRAGTTTRYCFGDDLTEEQANFNGNIGKTSPVGTYPPNAFGLYDMHGNVWEWCQDHWHDSYDSAPTDGSAWIIGGDNDWRMLRGGSWYNSTVYCCSTCRSYNQPDVRIDTFGFRVVGAPPDSLPWPFTLLSLLTFAK
ncbi:formylglycine-generating enzyme family protein [Leptolyngbyaceae cyanobacterium CCMR0082]|uniref:Formylglycine-generating enzyme family protein n=1 Tax=Adonisia turfae CCMR0082 TaxID=2304604 RepID=A0A6M0SBC2_9CYAN|nr:formylglycine-generating enzyme family protein [Adonisia turfae CCMR0082]